jgi:very-short-patch-repair endonuclease
MLKRILTHSASSTEKAKRLRKNMTLPETLFWSRVRSNKLGVHFRRQVPFGHMKKEAKEYDFYRDEYLRMHGFTVLRFQNSVLLADCDAIVQNVRHHIEVSKIQKRND